MWIRSLDDKLINLAVAEAMDLVEAFPEDASPEAIDAGTVPPEAFEVVAFMPSGWEAVIYASERSEEAERAMSFLAGLLASDGVSATLGGGRVRGLDELMARGQGAGRN
jgi:hypothetical protein